MLGRRNANAMKAPSATMLRGIPAMPVDVAALCVLRIQVPKAFVRLRTSSFFRSNFIEREHDVSKGGRCFEQPKCSGTPSWKVRFVSEAKDGHGCDELCRLADASWSGEVQAEIL